MSEKTFGEKRVRTAFNPSDDSTVQHIKERAAEMINYINDNVEAKDGDEEDDDDMAGVIVEEIEIAGFMVKLPERKAL